MTEREILTALPEGHLLVIAYKLADNRIVEYKGKSQLVSFILIALEKAAEKLQGKTLPANIGVIDKIFDV